MSIDRLSTAPPRMSRFEQLRMAREILRTEAHAVMALAESLGESFADAIGVVLQSRGSVIVTGMGKAGLVGQKIAATLASTGTRSHFLHPAEAIHGDLGRVGADDVVMMLSFSGETEEITRLLPFLASLGCPIVAITGAARSTLGQAASVILDVGPLREACALGLAPTTSTTAMLSLGDALAMVLSRIRGFRPEDFARFHPGGSLGRKMARVEELMRPVGECRIAADRLTIREVLVQVSRPGRRTGAIMLVDGAGRLSGLFTDSDLARLLETRADDALDQPVADVMTRRPLTAVQGQRAGEAVKLLAARKISELPVVDSHSCPIGLIDITDLVGLIESNSASDRSDDHDRTRREGPATFADPPAISTSPARPDGRGPETVPFPIRPNEPHPRAEP